MYHYFAIFNYVLFFQHTQVQIGLILSQIEICKWGKIAVWEQG